MGHKKNFSLENYLTERKALIDNALRHFLPAKDKYPAVIFEAVHYSLFAGGKRIRPILCLAAAEAAGPPALDLSPFLPVACALELIHTYSLIHDDLPALDNDDYRRGMPTSHKRFGEAIAILAGDALLTEAFHLLSSPELAKTHNPRVQLDIIHLISQAAGMGGMIGGQVIDLESEGKEIGLDTLYFMHRRKTGDLIKASLLSGALLAGAKEDTLNALAEYGDLIGLCFQITDDLLNIDGNEATLGKGTGSDRARGKATFPSLVGYEESRNLAEQLAREALKGLSGFGPPADPLRELAMFMVKRRL